MDVYREGTKKLTREEVWSACWTCRRPFRTGDVYFTEYPDHARPRWCLDCHEIPDHPRCPAYTEPGQCLPPNASCNLCFNEIYFRGSTIDGKPYCTPCVPFARVIKAIASLNKVKSPIS